MNRAYVPTILAAALACGGCATSSAHLQVPTEVPAWAAKASGAGWCRVVGPSRVVASKAFVPAGVEAVVGAELAAAGDAPLPAPAGPSADPRPRPSSLGIVVDERPRTAPAFGLASPTSAGPVAHTDRVPLPGDRVLQALVDGDVESHSARLRIESKAGEPLGPDLEVSPADVSAIGRPSVTLGEDGRGTVAFLASNGHGFSVLATPIACDR